MPELARPLLEEILEKQDTDWYRIAVYPSAPGAGIATGRLRKAYSDKEWEFRSVKLEETGQSAIYARWLGQSKKSL